jgi:hypothetical protein
MQKGSKIPIALKIPAKIAGKARASDNACFSRSRQPKDQTLSERRGVDLDTHSLAGGLRKMCALISENLTLTYE